MVLKKLVNFHVEQNKRFIICLRIRASVLSKEKHFRSNEQKIMKVDDCSKIINNINCVFGTTFLSN